MKRERRRYPRSAGPLPGVQCIGSIRRECVVCNVSSGGFFLESPEKPCRLGELVVVELAAAGEPLRVTGEVVYIAQGGVGVRITRADWARLSLLLK